MNPIVKGSLILLCKRAVALLVCVAQVLFCFQVMPYGGIYIGLLSLLLDVSIYCWVVSGACKAMRVSPGGGKTLAQHGANSRNLLLN